MERPESLSDCELCRDAGATVIWRNSLCRVILVDEPGYPGFCRVIWNAHVREMSDLAAADRAHCMAVVFGVEQALRKLMRPDKINIASLGNMVAHVHWHVIPRFRDDPHFPQPIWGVRQRETGGARDIDPAALADAIQAELKNIN